MVVKDRRSRQVDNCKTAVVRQVWKVNSNGDDVSETCGTIRGTNM